MMVKEKARLGGEPIPKIVLCGDNQESRHSLCQDQDSRRDFVLAQLRGASLRMRLIDNEIAAIGTALKGGFITPDTALEWAEEMAPGCVGFIPEAVTAHGEAV